MRIIVDTEFQRLLPAQSEEEAASMKSSLLLHGCLSPLIVWKNNGDATGVLLDGHNRYPFCKEKKIPYELKPIDLPSKEAARQWIIDHQLGRRNLTPEQLSYYRGLDYLNNLKTPGPKDPGQNDQKPEPSEADAKSTAEQLAEKHGVSEKTIRRDAEFSQAVDKIAETEGKEAKDAILSGESGFSKKEVVEESKRPKILCTLCQRAFSDKGKVKKNCVACKKLREQNRDGKSGKMVFDDKRIPTLIGQLVRALDERANAYNDKGEEHKACLAAMEAVQSAWARWQVKKEKA